jgi:hypothetical protein
MLFFNDLKLSKKKIFSKMLVLLETMSITVKGSSDILYVSMYYIVPTAF